MTGSIVIDPGRIQATRDALVERLCAARGPAGAWEGELSSSALSTATAVTALVLAARAGEEAHGDAELVRTGLEWLAATQNDDGGWGDTEDSPSNVSTTTLVWAALDVDPELAPVFRSVRARAHEWLKDHVGALTAPSFARAIARIYGDDRTFAVPILTMCTLAGVFGEGRKPWEAFPALPFELAALPHRFFHALGLPVVSYALPALIAIGQVRHAHAPSRNPLARALRELARRRTLAKLATVQPASGGFLEATPLTSFVAMSLVGCGQAHHAVTRASLRFLRASARPEGSWPIDTNLTTWLTSLAVDALAAGGRLEQHLSSADRTRLESWLLGQQYTEVHPYTNAAPGGWAWTDLPGGVPDADDTPAALIALRHLASREHHRVNAGVRWLVDLQNRDGGMPTFCRGYGKLPFDQSSPDLTAHALRAFAAWRDALPDELAGRVSLASERCRRYLLETQRSDGAWVPLWFGNQHTDGQASPLYGTARVLKAGPVHDDRAWNEALDRGARWILYTQSLEGGWGGAESVEPSLEETSLALEALCIHAEKTGGNDDLTAAIAHGAAWLANETDEGRRAPASPIGLYFAKLWYSERLYPWIFATAALQRALPHCQAEWTRI